MNRWSRYDDQWRSWKGSYFYMKDLRCRVRHVTKDVLLISRNVRSMRYYLSYRLRGRLTFDQYSSDMTQDIWNYSRSSLEILKSEESHYEIGDTLRVISLISLSKSDSFVRDISDILYEPWNISWWSNNYRIAGKRWLILLLFRNHKEHDYLASRIVTRN